MPDWYSHSVADAAAYERHHAAETWDGPDDREIAELAAERDAANRVAVRELAEERREMRLSSS